MSAPVVVSTTSKTTTSRVLAVFAYTTVTGGDVPAVLASVREAGRHLSMVKADKLSRKTLASNSFTHF